MQSKWLAKSVTAVVLVAVMAAETVNPIPAYAGVPGVFATEFTQIMNYVELAGQLEQQVSMPARRWESIQRKAAFLNPPVHSTSQRGSQSSVPIMSVRTIRSRNPHLDSSTASRNLTTWPALGNRLKAVMKSRLDG
ncbi:MAG: hypothetical protein WCA21_14600 [Terracidiphilus sp.]